MTGAGSGRARRRTPAGAFGSPERAHPVSGRAPRGYALLEREPRKSDIEALTGPQPRDSEPEALTVPPGEYPSQNLPSTIEEAVLQAIEQITRAPSSPELPAAAYVKRSTRS